MTESGGPSPARGQLDALLNNLYDFGDDFVTHEEKIPEPEEKTPEPSQWNKRSEEKECEAVSARAEDQRLAARSKRGKRNMLLFFDSIKDELSSQAKNPTMSSSSAPKPSTVEVVTFVSRKDKEQRKDKDIAAVNAENGIDEAEDEHSLEFDLEKARLEVHKFGITGYKKEKQRKFEQERAIMLGAKPPKREYVNYKVYQEKLKEKIQEQKENGLEPLSKKQAKGNDDRRSRRTKASAPSGQVGRFRHGALFLSGKDIKKINKSRVVK